MRVPIGEGRAKLRDAKNGLEIEVPAKKNWFLILFMGFWLCGWAFGEVSVTAVLLFGEKGPHSLFMIAWLGGWTVAGAFAVLVWLWNVAGKEIVRINASEISIGKALGGYCRSKEYDATHVTDLRAGQGPASLWSGNRGLEFWGISGGTVLFDYGRKTVRFGINLDEAEAKYLSEEIKQRFDNF